MGFRGSVVRVHSSRRLKLNRNIELFLFPSKASRWTSGGSVVRVHSSRLITDYADFTEKKSAFFFFTKYTLPFFHFPSPIFPFPSKASRWTSGGSVVRVHSSRRLKLNRNIELFLFPSKASRWTSGGSVVRVHSSRRLKLNRNIELFLCIKKAAFQPLFSF